MNDWVPTGQTVRSEEGADNLSGSETDSDRSIADRASAVADGARSAARQAADQGREYVRRQIDAQADQYGERLAGTASNLQSAAAQLRASGESSLGSIAEAGSRWLDGASRYLKEVDGERLMRDVNDFTRQRPWVVIATGLVLGVAVGRFVKSGGEGAS